MNASKRASKKQILFASILAAVVACLGLLLALPHDYRTASLQPARLLANTLDTVTTTAPVQLTESILLEPGATLQVLPEETPNKTENPANTTTDSAPTLLLTGATLTFDLAATQASVSSPSVIPSNEFYTGPMVGLVKSLGFKQLNVRNAVVQVRRPGGSLRKIGHITTKLAGAASAGDDLDIDGEFTRDNRTVEFKALSKPTEDGGATSLNVKIADVDLSFEFEGILSKRGGLRISAEKSNLKTTNLKALLNWLGMGPVQGRGLSTFEASGALSWTGSSVAFDQARFVFDGNQANGRLSFYFDPGEPSITGTLAFRALNLNSYLGDATNATPERLLRDTWGAMQDQAAENSLPLGLKHINVDLRLSTKSIQIGDNDIGSGAAVIICRDGKLKTDLVDIHLTNGIQGRAHVEVDIGDYLPSYVFNGDFRRVDLGGASQLLVGHAVVDGIADVTFDLTAQGRESAVLIKTLTGPIRISAQNGASLPIDVVKLFSQTKQMPNDGWNKFEGGFTALKNLNIELISANGMLKTRSAKANFDGSAFVAKGTLKLNDFVLDMILTKLATSDDATAVQDVYHGDALQLRGPIKQPVIRMMPQAHRG